MELARRVKRLEARMRPAPLEPIRIRISVVSPGPDGPVLERVYEIGSDGRDILVSDASEGGKA
jgi:hypothetical protein